MLNNHDLEIWIRGQSRSFKLVPFESLGAASYSHSIVTMAVSLTVYEIFSFKESFAPWKLGYDCSRLLKMVPFNKPYDFLLARCCKKYEGHSINKLWNGVVLLIFRLKLPNVHFVEDLIRSMSYEFCYDDVTVTSILWTLDMSTLPLKQGTAFCYSFAVGCVAGRQDVVSHVHTAMRKVYSLHSSSRQM